MVKQYISVLPQNPYEEQQEPKVEPAQVWPLLDPHWPFPETGKLAVGVLVTEEDVEDAIHELTTSVTTVVAVEPLVIVCVNVCSSAVGPGIVRVVVMVAMYLDMHQHCFHRTMYHDTNVVTCSVMLGGVAVEMTVVVVRSVLKVGAPTMNVRDEIVGTPGTLGWLNLSVYVPGENRLSVMLGHSKPE